MAERSGLLGSNAGRGEFDFEEQKRPTSRVKILIIGSIIAVICTLVILGAVYLAKANKDKQAMHLENSITSSNIMIHLTALNDLAKADGSNSRSIVDAYNASAQFVASTLSGKADCDIQYQYFQVPVYVQLANPTLSQTSPLSLNYVLNVDFSGTRYGGNGTYNMTRPIFIAQNLGCNVSDYENITAGDIAVAFNNNCTQYQKALAAEQAGAGAILIVNNRGSTLSNWRVRSVWWSGEQLVQIPVLGITYSLGALFQQQPETTLSITTSSQVTIETTYNVLCLTRKGRSDRILVAGAHLDSVPEGPGINDNGSGSASLLEIALQLHSTNIDLDNKILFAWWGAEEIGLLGSRYFVSQLLQNGNAPGNSSNFIENLTVENTLLNLNFDMLASPNFVRYVYNWSTPSNSSVAIASERIKNTFAAYFDSQNLPFVVSPMTGGSDYFSFSEQGIPASALATGAGGIKSMAERSVYGGFANAPYDPCYHLACDTTDNIGQDVLQQMAKAAAYTIQNLAQQDDLHGFLYQ